MSAERTKLTTVEKDRLINDAIKAALESASVEGRATVIRNIVDLAVNSNTPRLGENPTHSLEEYWQQYR